MSRVALITSAFFVGLFARSLRPDLAHLGWLGIGSLFLGGLVVARPRLGARGTQLLLVIGAFTAGAAGEWTSDASGIALGSGNMRVDAIVESARASPRGSSCVLIVEHAQAIGQSAAPHRGDRLWATPILYAPGTRIRFLARVRPSIRFRNPSPHPDWPNATEIAYRARVIDVSQVRVLGRDAWSTGIEGVRAYVRHRLRNTLDEQSAGIASALVLGDAAAVDPEDNTRVRNAGLSHVLAVSGMHVAILAGFFVLCLRALLLRVPHLSERIDVRRIACAVGCVVALIYAEFAGGSPSAWRSAWTASFAWALVACGKRPRVGAVGAVAALAMSVFDTTMIVRPAFLLSVLATSALISLPCMPNSGAMTYIQETARTSVRASIATLPVLAWCFDGTPVVGVIANAVLVPLGSVVLLPLATVHAIAACLCSPLVLVTRLPLEVSTRAFVNGCDYFAAISFGRNLPPLNGPQLVALSAGCALVLLVDAWARRAWIALATCMLLGVAELWLRHQEEPHGKLRATFLDVWQGDSTLVDMPDGRLMLIDGGGNPEHGPDPGERVLLPLLHARRRSRIDVVVITHPHPDHYGGIRALVGVIPIGEIWDSGQAEAEPNHTEASQLLARARALGIPVRGPERLCGRAPEFGAAKVEILAPCPRFDPGYEPNDNSLVLRIRMGRRTLLFAGDAEAHEEQTLLSRAGPALDILKVGHHGSRTSSTTSFLAAFRPRHAIISAGRGNRFPHPHPETLERLRASHAAVTRLDDTGGVMVTTDGDDLTVE